MISVKTLLIHVAAGAVALCTWAVAQAADQFKIDPAHTNIVFLVNHLGYSDMIGQFQEFEGEFTFDQNDHSKGMVNLNIKTASVDTDHQARDDHLRSPDFFNAAEFPDMTFKSTSVSGNGDKKLRVTGDLTLLGVTKPVTLDVDVNDIKPHPLAQYKGVLVAGFSARSIIKRSDFGMKYALGGIGDEIRLLLEVEGHKK
jgi:polyisoprenoid-binding protein YceI